ncbi:uncharacterized protein METZ01_LOCUS245174 [marine metagenome]|uniref:Uncharacterized protein n=1 Tax=marine metagenome TaxID=408172 RepID=A0A382HY87_9ZZZZ
MACEAESGGGRFLRLLGDVYSRTVRGRNGKQSTPWACIETSAH